MIIYYSIGIVVSILITLYLMRWAAVENEKDLFVGVIFISPMGIPLAAIIWPLVLIILIITIYEEQMENWFDSFIDKSMERIRSVKVEIKDSDES